MPHLYFAKRFKFLKFSFLLLLTVVWIPFPVQAASNTADHSLLVTLVTAIAVGMSLLILADKLKIPSIGLLLLAGILLGPEVAGVVSPSSLGSGLQVLVALAVGLILFEGAISLDFRALKMSPKAIRGLLSVGAVITWLGCSAVIYWVCEVPLEIAILSGSLIIVTGPTVIAPLLLRVKVKQRLAHILRWEGVLIDPIGVFIALLCFEWIVVPGSSWDHVTAFLFRILIGGVLGILGGRFIEEALRRKWIHKSMHNIFVLSCSVLLFGVSDLISSESGILTVVVAGCWLAQRMGEEIKGIIHFHEELVRLVIGVLFILLSANLELSGFVNLGWNGPLALFLILLLVRPANVFLSTITSSLSLREKFFLSWLNPRGIVAASMASLFALLLVEPHDEYAWFLESFTFFVIITTVLIQGFFTGFVARLFNVEAEPRTDWLVVGSDSIAFGMARFLQSVGLTVSMVDRSMNYDFYQETDHFELIEMDILEIKPLHDPRYDKIGYVLCATTNKDLNILASQVWSDEILEPEQVLILTTEPISQEGVPIILNDESLAHVDHGLLQDDLSLVTRRAENEDQRMQLFTSEGELLMMRVGDRVLPPDMRHIHEATEFLFLVKHTQPLSHYLRSNLIFPEMTPSDIVSFLLTCAERVANELEYIDVDTLSTELLKTEPLLSSYIGNGIAVPRVFSSKIVDVVCAVIRVPEGVQYIPGSKHKAHLLFFVVAPESKQNVLTDLLHKIENIRDDSRLRNALLQENDPKEIFLLFQ